MITHIFPAFHFSEPGELLVTGEDRTAVVWKFLEVVGLDRNFTDHDVVIALDLAHLDLDKTVCILRNGLFPLASFVLDPPGYWPHGNMGHYPKGHNLEKHNAKRKAQAQEKRNPQ